MSWAERLTKWWAARSLMVGACSTALDLGTGALMLWLGGSTRLIAMSGTTVGSTFSYFANRHIAFKDHQAPVASSGLKFILLQVVLSTAHGQVVVWLRDGAGIPIFLAKIMADLLVVTFPQLYIMRRFIFPQKPA